MFNLDKLLYNMLITVKTYRGQDIGQDGNDMLNVSERDVSLSARLNYYIRLFRRFQNYLSSYKTKSSLNTVNSTVGSVAISGQTAQTIGTAYYWKDLQLDSSSGIYTENGLYVIYNGKVLGHADMKTSNGIHYTHFDITLPAPIDSYIGTSNNVDAAVFCSIFNNRAIGVHGCFRGTNTLTIYLYSTNSSDYIDSRINVFIYIPKTEVTRIIK